MTRILLQLLALYIGGIPACAKPVEVPHFLSRGPGAGAAALGNAVLPVVSDPTALYWNPAGLARAGGAVAGEHLFLFGGARYNFIGLSFPSRLGTFGLGAIQLQRGRIVARRAIDDPGTEVAATQADYLLGYARSLPSGWSAGTALNVLDYNLAGRRALGFGLDLGVSGRYPAAGWRGRRRGLWRFGAVIKNLMEPSLTLDLDRERLPRELRWGLGYAFDAVSRAVTGAGEIRRDRATLLASFAKTAGVPGARGGGGLSYVLHNMFILRLGYNRGVTAGVGFRTSDDRFLLDYALEDKPLTRNHRFTVTYRFSAPAAEVPLVERDDGYRTVRARARSLSDERLAAGKQLFADRRFVQAAQQLEEAAILFPDDPDREELRLRALEAYRRELLKELRDKAGAAMEAERWDATSRALWGMARLGEDVAEPALLAAMAREGAPKQASSKSLDSLVAEGKQEVLALFTAGRAQEAARLAAALAVVIGGQGEPARLAAWSEEEASRRKAFMQGRVSKATESGDMARAAALAHELTMAFPDDEEVRRAATHVLRRYEPRPPLSGRERLYLRKLYYLAAIRCAKREYVAAADLLAEILRRNAADPDARALRERLLLKGLVPAVAADGREGK
ncbi:MAG: PorV/PorQ family protein [Elusimicrobiota bacterium]